ncbi:unnamed protein product, partial [Caretta caretta]
MGLGAECLNLGQDGGRFPQTIFWVKEGVRACWDCGQQGHLWRECPGPRNTTQGNPGRADPVRDNRKKQEAQATWRQGACWHCREPGHLWKDCPLGGGKIQLEAAERVADRPVGHPGEVAKIATRTVRILRPGRTQTIARE